MAIIAFPMDLSPQGPQPQFQWGQRSISGRYQSPLNGVITTRERPGSAWTARIPYHNLASSRRARLQTFAVSSRGYANRFYMPLFGWTRRGSFPCPELLTNNTFANGTTGWTPSGTPAPALSAADGILRVTLTGATINPQAFQGGIAATQYAPYAVRGLALHGRGSVQSYQAAWNDGITFPNASGSSGINTAVGVTVGATIAATPVYNSMNPAAGMAGDYFGIGYASLARCALVDNGPNLLIRSDEFGSWGIGGGSVTANATTAPDGTATADALVEDASTGAHDLFQAATVSSAAADYAFSIALKAGSRGFATIQISTAGGDASVAFNLATGAVTVAAAASGNWSNARSFVTDLGSGFFRFTIVARKNGSETSVQAVAYAKTSGGGSVSYTGTNALTAFYAWRGTLSQSSVPSRLSQTVASATTGTAQTGSALYLKGLPASTSGLLLQGDPVEVITNTSSQLVRARSALDSDAAGLGYFEFEAPLRVSPLDNAAVIVCNPLCRMMLDSANVDWMERAPALSDFEFSAIEDLV